MSSASLLDENGDYSVGTNDGNFMLLCVFFSINCGFFVRSGNRNGRFDAVFARSGFIDSQARITSHDESVRGVSFSLSVVVFKFLFHK